MEKDHIPAWSDLVEPKPEELAKSADVKKAEPTTAPTTGGIGFGSVKRSRRGSRGWGSTP